MSCYFKHEASISHPVSSCATEARAPICRNGPQGLRGVAVVRAIYLRLESKLDCEVLESTRWNWGDSPLTDHMTYFGTTPASGAILEICAKVGLLYTHAHLTVKKNQRFQRAKISWAKNLAAWIGAPRSFGLGWLSALRTLNLDVMWHS